MRTLQLLPNTRSVQYLSCTSIITSAWESDYLFIILTSQNGAGCVSNTIKWRDKRVAKSAMQVCSALPDGGGGGGLVSSSSSDSCQGWFVDGYSPHSRHGNGELIGQGFATMCFSTYRGLRRHETGPWWRHKSRASDVCVRYGSSSARCLVRGGGIPPVSLATRGLSIAVLRMVTPLCYYVQLRCKIQLTSLHLRLRLYNKLGQRYMVVHTRTCFV